MIYDLAIIGGGPAGMTAGIYAARQKVKAILIAPCFGGQMAHKAVEIENYPGFKKISGLELINSFEEQLREKDIEIKEEKVIKIGKDEFFHIFTENQEITSKTVIIATGSEPRKINVKGEDEFIGKGVSYCVTCDGPLYKNKKVAVIGGGEAGFETALFLSAYASEIYVLEYSDKLKASREAQEKALKTNKVKIILKAQLKEIQGSAFVEKILYNDASLDVQGVFVQIGYTPASSVFANLVDLNRKKEIIVDPITLETKTKGLFAVGDVNNGKVKQIVVACAEGAKAAIESYRYIYE